MNGVYDLISWDPSRRDALAPPEVEGTLVLTEDRYDLGMRIPGPTGAPMSIYDRGETTTDENGAWEQRSNMVGTMARGEYSIDGDVLTIEITHPRAVGIVTKWKLRS